MYNLRFHSYAASPRRVKRAVGCLNGERMSFRLLILFLAACALSIGCVGTGKTKIDERLIGEWQTDKILSQLGESQSYQHFKKDGTFVLRTTLFQMRQTLSTEGTFTTQGEQIYLQSPDKSLKQSYRIENGILIIYENGGDTFKYKKISK